MEALDQCFVSLKSWVVGLFPAVWQPWVSAGCMVAAILGVFPGVFGLVTVLERKGIGRMQNRLGPNRVGPYGFLQFAADGIKALTKEDVVPRMADRWVHFLAPIALFIPVVLTYAVIPFGRNMVAIDLDTGLLFFFAVGAGTELAVFMAGWSGRNKYALFGAMRAVAQMISYELPLILSTVTVVMMTGSLSTVEIVQAQSGSFLGVMQWHVWTPWGAAGFLLFLVAAIAEANRAPFDLPEGESEIIAGYFLEYSGFKFALFFLAEYLGMFAACGMAITLFLGGWHAPVTFLSWIPSWIWFFGKLFVLIFFLIWIRGTLPRLRMDQLMNFAWKFLLPLTLINVVVTALWSFTGTWSFLGSGGIRWGASAAILVMAYVGLGRALMRGKQLGPRTYRYAS